MDFYGGYKTTFGDFGVDLGAIAYYYPGSQGKVLGTGASSGAVTNKELYIGGSWKFVSLKYFYSLDDYFSLRGWDSAGNSTGKSTKGTGYLDLSLNYDLGDGWGINAHVGRLNLKNGYKGDYTELLAAEFADLTVVEASDELLATTRARVVLAVRRRRRRPGRWPG